MINFLLITEVMLSLGSMHVYGKGIMDITKYSDLDQQVAIEAINCAHMQKTYLIKKCYLEDYFESCYRPLRFNLF